MAGHFEVRKTETNQYFFCLFDSNGKILFTSESYSTHADANQGIAALKERVESFPNFERKKNSENKMFFVVRTARGKVIGSSERYSSIADLENSITAVNQSVVDAEIIDGTGD